MPVTLTIHPLRDGTNSGEFVSITLPDGEQILPAPVVGLLSRQAGLGLLPIAAPASVHHTNDARYH
jgi:hypothetical protein